MDHGLISIIVPVYNAEPFLESFAKSLSRQTVQDYEVLFINDHSPDNSGPILQRLTRRDSRLKYFEHETNHGAGGARNTGLDNATGEYVMYIDADDSFAPNYLERMRDVIEKDGSDVAVCNSIWEYVYRPCKKNIFLAHPETAHCLFNGRDLLRRFFHVYESDLWLPPEPWAKIVRRSHIERHQMRFREIIYEDLVMTFEEMLVAERVSCIGDFLYHYNRTNENAITVSAMKRYIDNFYRAPEGVLAALEKHGLATEMSEYATLFYFSFLDGAYTCFSRGSHFKEELREAIRKYRGLLTKPQAGNHMSTVLWRLQNLQNELNRYGWSDLFSFFIEPHREWLGSAARWSLGLRDHPEQAAVRPLFRTLLQAPGTAFQWFLRRAG